MGMLQSLKAARKQAIEITSTLFRRTTRHWYGLIFTGYVVGACTELVKIHWKVGNIHFYSVFHRKQLQRRLAAFEDKMKYVNSFLLDEEADRDGGDEKTKP